MESTEAKTRRVGKKIVYSIARIFSTKFLVIFVGIVVLFNVATSSLLPSNPFSVSAADIDANELVTLTNAERLAQGLAPLTIDSRLVQAAEAKGLDMIEKDYWAHYGPNGETPWQFILAAGYDYTYAGENLAKDFTSTVPVHNAWMASPTHKSNIINSEFVNIGISVVTGEFQGKQTTIVVQMFGRTADQKVLPSDSIDEGALPETGEEGELVPPKITEPQNGDILDTGAFSVRGEAEEGLNVTIYDNNEPLGDSDVENSTFTYDNPNSYGEGYHFLYAQSYEEETDRRSEPSEPVGITVDTIHPNIQKDSARFDYSEEGQGFNHFIFSIEVEDNPSKVIGLYKNTDIMCSSVGDRWECIINEPEEVFEAFALEAIDDAGNNNEVLIESSDMNTMASEVITGIKFSQDFATWFIEDLPSRIFTRSLRGQINFFFGLFMIIVLIAQQVMLTRTGLTKTQSNSMLHLGVFSILIFVGILGSGGEIL